MANINYLVNDQGTWSSGTQYVVQQMSSVAGLVYYACPKVTYNGVTYVAKDVTNQPVLATAPTADDAWVIFVGSVQPTIAPVLVASTANLTLSGEQTIDGVLTSTNRVLVKNQTLTQNNGVYVTAAGAWTRATDSDTWAELVGSSVEVLQGSTQAGFIYSCTVSPGGTLGTTPVTYVKSGVSDTITGTYPIVVANDVVSITHTNGFVKGMVAAGISEGAITINGGTNVVTSNLTVNATSVSLPLNSSINVTAILDVTTGLTSGATFTITGTNCTATTQAIAVGASITNQYMILSAYITTTATANPSFAIVASALTGTVDIAADSYMQISQG